MSPTITSVIAVQNTPGVIAISQKTRVLRALVRMARLASRSSGYRTVASARKDLREIIAKMRDNVIEICYLK